MTSSPAPGCWCPSLTCQGDKGLTAHTCWLEAPLASSWVSTTGLGTGGTQPLLREDGLSGLFQGHGHKDWGQLFGSQPDPELTQEKLWSPPCSFRLLGQLGRCWPATGGWSLGLQGVRVEGCF